MAKCISFVAYILGLTMHSQRGFIYALFTALSENSMKRGLILFPYVIPGLAK